MKGSICKFAKFQLSNSIGKSVTHYLFERAETSHIYMENNTDLNTAMFGYS